MNSTNFIETVRNRGTAISPVIAKIMDVQLERMGITQEMLTPVLAEEYIARVSNAASFIVGPEVGIMLRNIMYRQLREEAPDYFASKGLL